VSAAAIALTGSSVRADFAFGKPVNSGPVVNSPALEAQPSISGDGLSLFFYSERSGGYGNRDIWVARRATTDEAWTTLENVGPPVNTSYRDSGPCISADGLTLFFDSDRPGGSGQSDIWVTRRATTSDPWGTPVNLGPPVNASSYDAYPSVSADGLTLVMQSNLPGGYGGYDIWMATRQTKDAPWTAPVNLGPPVNSSALEGDPEISPDGLTVFFGSPRAGGYGSWDVYMARRATTDDRWGTPVNLGPVINMSSPDYGPNISPDGRTFYFASDRPGGEGSGDLWQASVVPIIDFNGNGTADIEDLVVLIESWGQADPRCDIGPMPWGDGKVDAADLEVLMSCWGQPVDDPTLLAHWPLDETEGMIASDSAGDHDGTVTGLPAWQPVDGQIGGALQFDGATCITADFVLNPADGPFSVLAWVKGGAPGQVIVSQEDGLNWLIADLAQAALATDLAKSLRTTGLSSQAIITDGAWHHVAFTWDGASRRLYVDEILVAEDTLDKLVGSVGNMILGAGRNMTPDTFWPGLIDDVRIYGRAVEP